MKNRARAAGIIRFGGCDLSVRLREQRVECFADNALAGTRELAYPFELLLDAQHRFGLALTTRR